MWYNDGAYTHIPTMSPRNPSPSPYTISVPEGDGLWDDWVFEDVYEAREALLDALDGVGGRLREWELRGMLWELEPPTDIESEHIM